MFFNLLIELNISKLSIAGFDGFSDDSTKDFADDFLQFETSNSEYKNSRIANFVKMLENSLTIHFLTPSIYQAL